MLHRLACYAFLVVSLFGVAYSAAFIVRSEAKARKACALYHGEATCRQLLR